MNISTIKNSRLPTHVRFVKYLIDLSCVENGEYVINDVILFKRDHDSISVNSVLDSVLYNKYGGLIPIQFYQLIFSDKNVFFHYEFTKENFFISLHNEFIRIENR